MFVPAVAASELARDTILIFNISLLSHYYHLSLFFQAYQLTCCHSTCPWGEGNGYYPCHWRNCKEEDTSRTNICIHVGMDRLCIILRCSNCENAVLSTTTCKSHITKMHAQVMETLKEASEKGGPSKLSIS